jgi:6-phosphofructokinase 1
MTASAGNLLIVQGGGPTPVLNTTLAAIIESARPSCAAVLGARFGVEGLIRGDLLNLCWLSSAEIERLRITPGAALGSSRLAPGETDLQAILSVLRTHAVRGVIIIGGNGSLRGAAALAEAVSRDRQNCCVVGVPKTVDNDISGTDRCPGFASAARHVAQSVRDLGMDLRTLPQPVSLFETMGRTAGWLAGASILARLDDDHAPHLVYFPERAFELERFLDDVDRCVARRGWAVAVVPEGLTDAGGRAVYESAHATQADALGRALCGGIAAYLADVVASRLKIRCRWEKPGLCGRASMLHVSPQDRLDADAVGRAGVAAVLAGRHGQMVSLRPLSQCIGGEIATDIVPLNAAGAARGVPSDWITDDPAQPIAQAFDDYLRPIVGPLISYALPLTDRLPFARTP